MASQDQLISQYNQQAGAVRTLNAAVNLVPTAGSAMSGVIEQYHEVNGFLLAARPASIRLIGQAPVLAKDIFDMVSDGKTFRIYIPSKNKFIVGSTKIERPAKKPIENLRPQHLLDALFWPEIPLQAPVLIEEWDALPERDYILTVVRGAPAHWGIARKIWFDRSNLKVSRLQIFGSDGTVLSDIRYTDWQPAAEIEYPRHIWLSRPRDDYQLELRIKRLTLNEPLPLSRFELLQPPGSELVRVGESAPENEP